MEGKIESSETSVKEGLKASGAGTKGGVELDMDWELEDAALAAEAKIVDAIPSNEKKYGGDDLDLDVESFSFESKGDTEEEEEVGLSKAFDVKTLQRAIEASVDALDLVTDKDVVMVIGKTGVGKSLFLQGIAGKRLNTIEHETSFAGQTTFKRVYVAEEELPEFEVGHSATSKTASLNGLIRGNHVYLDSPGLGDTSGIEMDIATSCLLSQVAKRCKSLRFVVLVHFASLLEDRGEAFRSVLKFARSFVEDFNKSKTCFIFLFTHSDEIEGSNSLDDAKKRLLGEIIHAADGLSEDDEVVAVLDFLRQSLNKGYRFASILHPLETDIQALANFIEKGLKKFSDLSLASRCNLTLPSKLKLEGSIQNLLQTLRVSLRESSIEQAKEVSSILQYLKKYIDVDCVRDGAGESKEILNEHISITNASVEDLVHQGTSSDLEFNEVHLLRLKDFLTTLAGLADDTPGLSEHNLNIIEGGLLEFKDAILAKVRAVEPFHEEMKKVSVWAGGFDNFGPIYVNLCMEVTEYIQGLADALVKIDIPSLPELSSEGIGVFVDHLYRLHVICDQINQLQAIDLSRSNAVLAKDAAMQQLRDTVGGWTKNAPSCIGSDQGLQVVASHVKTLHCINEHIQAATKEHKRDFARVEEFVSTSEKILEDEVVGRFNNYCTELMVGAFDHSWKSPLTWMQAVCNRFAAMKGNSWKCLQPSFFALLDMAKSVLYKVAGELDTMAHLVLEHGMTSGNNLAKELMELEKCQWFDTLLSENQVFVTNYCGRVRCAVNNRIEAKTSELGSQVPSLNREDSSNVIRLVGSMLPELREIDRYLAVVTGLDFVHSNLAETQIARLEKYTSDLGGLGNKCISYWSSNVQKSNIGYGCMRSITRKLNSILADVEALLATNASDKVIEEALKIQSQFQDEFAKFTKAARAEFSSFGETFGLKVTFLVTMKACRSFTFVERHLTGCKKLHHGARDLVSKQAKRLEQMISSSSEWGEIDKFLAKFGDARVLDPFVCEEVSTRLSTLRRIREQKENQVDSLVQEMIQTRNFRGIDQFLAPLSRSDDQVQKQKFQSHQEEIGSTLEGLINGVYRLLDDDSALEHNSKVAAEHLDVLMAAKSELQDLLFSRINLVYEIPKLKRQINDVLNNYTKLIAEGAKKRDLIQMALNRRQGSLFLNHMKNHLPETSVQLFEAAKCRVKSEVESVPKYVDRFFKSGFEDGSDLFHAMSSLKETREIESLSKLTEIYERTKKVIASKIHCEMKRVKTSVYETQCYDDGINYLHILHRQLQGGLRDHCSSELVNECARFVEELRQQKKKHDCMLEFGGHDYKNKIGELSMQLDHLHSKASQFSWLWGNKHSKTYDRLQTALIEEVEGRYSKARVSLNSRNLVSVQECIEFLDCVEKKAGKHINIGRRVQSLYELCIQSFEKLCDEAKGILEDPDSIISFKEIFADYRSFVVDVPCVLHNQECQKLFSIINQLLFESLESNIATLKKLVDADIFDSSSLRSKVLFTREWGNFIADHLTLLHEEVTICAHAKPDNWLIKIHKLCWHHFNCGRDLSKVKDCAILGVLPSATKSEIDKAFRETARREHPDKQRSRGGDSVKFRAAKEAQEHLLTMSHLNGSIQAQPFDEIIMGVGEVLRDRAKSFMIEQRFDMAEKLLFELPNLRVIDDLVNPKLNSHGIIMSIYSLVKGHVEKVRVEVDSNWSSRNYKDLNDVIANLKTMEKHFAAYPQIFPESWDAGICTTIEAEIECLGQNASACLKSRALAKQKEAVFRRCFIHMGFVLVELPMFKDFTKSIMSSVLEKSLDTDWGYGYLFEFGLSLQKGDGSSSDDENRISQMIISEFSHFQEVLTLVWNEEVSQKPAEDVVQYIRGEHQVTPTQAHSLNIDSMQLLECFRSYDTEYKSLLADYIKPEADLNALVRKIRKLAKQMSPQNKGNDWLDPNAKRNLPTLLAGVFSLFTVLKSGASYNRLEAAAGTSKLGDNLLMKPHNIQVFTILSMLGCGGQASSLESQLMQIRTGEGKSIVLGAASVMLALLGFRVRTVCYSADLSNRDFKLFEEVFDRLGVTQYIKYSKITTFAEDSTFAKGDIRDLTESLLRGTLSPVSSPNTSSKQTTKTPPLTVLGRITTCLSTAHGTREAQSTLAANNVGAVLIAGERKEIMLVDEVDVFFSSEFYGQTYNQVVEFREPEIEVILKRIWNAWSQGGRRLKLSDIKSMPEYACLSSKLSSFDFLLDNEISLMLDQVSKVDEIPYYLDTGTDKIGYKVIDSISYDATYGYATVFAYLKEQRKLKKRGTLAKVLAMPISCGQFSYANISPHRILGVSGTLQALGAYERRILLKYGLNKYSYLPSVYGASNFSFDKAGNGIYFERNKSNYYHRIAREINSTTKAKRAVIVFFRDGAILKDFMSSPTYRLLTRHKKPLTEDMNAADKGFVIKKAATAGQITLSTAVFGRGTDFFCKDDVVEANGGVHVIQTFLSEEESEEIQIQGRTARQGKQGSYQLVLLESDLETEFGVQVGEKDKVAKKDLYDWLCDKRMQKHSKQCKIVDENLFEAIEKDGATRMYFDSLLAGNKLEAAKMFGGLYDLIKKAPMPSSLTLDLAVAIDSTGSMSPYSKCVKSTIKSLVSGQKSILAKLRASFPEIEFKMRVGCLAFRDIDDNVNQFKDKVWKDGSHFTADIANALNCISSVCKSARGGADIAEDIMGAIQHCALGWNAANDWTADIKFLMVLTDAPAHGLTMPTFSAVKNYDSYPTRHPSGLTSDSVISSLLSKDISLLFCSFDPNATAKTEEELSQKMKNHPDNKSSDRGIIRIPMVTNDQLQTNYGSCFNRHNKHIVFVLDESGSMGDEWVGVVDAYNKYIEKRKQSQSTSDLISVVQFGSQSRITVQKESLSSVPNDLDFACGLSTLFHPAAIEACQVAQDTLASHIPSIIFMSDGVAHDDASAAAREFSVLNHHVSHKFGRDLELHVVAFGGVEEDQLHQIAGSSRSGKVHASANTAELATLFVSIAANKNVATLLESEVAKQISEAVSDKLSLEYFDS